MIKIKNLFAGYSNKDILIDLSLDIPSGEITGVIGPNGAGKTTFLRTITNLLKPRSGTIVINNKNIYNYKGAELAKSIAVVKQSLTPEMITVYDYLLLGRYPYFKRFQLSENKNDRDIAEHYLNLTGIANHRNDYISELSGGELQMAQIARALVQEPKILILDEPTSHLDISKQIKILDLIKKLNKELKISVIMVQHDLNLASEYCQKLLLMKNGEKFIFDATEKVITYQNIETVYKTPVIVEKNPLSGKPYVLLITEENLHKVH